MPRRGTCAEIRRSAHRCCGESRSNRRSTVLVAVRQPPGRLFSMPARFDYPLSPRNPPRGIPPMSKILKIVTAFLLILLILGLVLPQTYNISHSVVIAAPPAK